MSELMELLKKNGFRDVNEQQVSAETYRIQAFRQNAPHAFSYEPGSSLLFSTGDSPGWEERIEHARKICTPLMGAEPICGCKAKMFGVWGHYVMWRLRDPEEYLRNIVNGGADFAGLEMRNLELYGGYLTSDSENKAL